MFAAQVYFCLIDAINKCEIKLQYSQFSCIVSGHCMYQPLAVVRLTGAENMKVG